jgi:Domain of unknown function (DUF4296)
MRVFLLLPLLLCACSGTPSVPKDVMPPEKLGAVLYDVIRSDEMVDFLQTNDSAYRSFSKRASLYDTIFQLHAVKKQEFQRSLKYYQGRPDLLKEILDSLQKKVPSSPNPKTTPLVQ